MTDPAVEENTTAKDQTAQLPDIEEELDAPPDIPDSEFDLDPITEAEVLGNQAYQLIIAYNQTKMTARGVKSVNGKQYDELMSDLARIKNQLGYIYQKNSRAKQVKNRIAKEDAAKFKDRNSL